MKQQEISKETYDELIRLCNYSKDDYDREIIRRNKHASDQNLKKYANFFDEFYPHLKKYEGFIRFMYVDLNFYITVGCGHLLGFNKYSFWNSREVNAVFENLTKQMESENLKQNSNFTDIPLPVDVDSFLNVSEEDLLKLFNTKYVVFSFLDAKDLNFKINEGKNEDPKAYTNINDPNIYLRTVLSTYIKLLGCAVKLKSRQQYLRRVNENPFRSFRFNIKEQNPLVLDDDEMKKLTFRDLLVKLGEAKDYCKKFDDFPLSAQKAFLDIAYTGLSESVIALAKEENWEKLTDTTLYGRSKSSYTDRNEKVKLWFKEAASAKTLAGKD